MKYMSSVLVVLFSGCTTSAPRNTTAISHLEKELATITDPSRYHIITPSKVCIQCNKSMESQLEDFRRREKNIADKEQELKDLLKPRSASIKDPLSPQYQEHLRSQWALIKKAQFDRNRRANATLFSLLQDEKHLYTYDPIFLDQLNKVRAQYKVIHEEATKRLAQKYETIKKERGAAQAKHEIDKLRIQELRRLVNVANGESDNPLSEVNSHLYRETLIKREHLVKSKDPF